jgi:membrane protein YdbS with pleckstrin-like domain
LPAAQLQPWSSSSKTAPRRIEQTDLRKLDPAIQKVWRIRLLITGAVATLVAAAYDVTNLFDDGRFLPLGLATGLVLLVFGLSTWLLPGLRYRFWAFRLDDEELRLVRGIFNRVTTIVPLRRVQHMDVSQDIIEREFELGNLIVHTAGTRSSQVLLPGLRFDEAQQLRDRIKLYITDEPV